MLRAVFLTSALLGVGIVQAQEATVESYRYGQLLDVARVVSIQAPSTLYCESVTAVMTYLDSAGQEQKVAYRKMSDGCDVGN